MAKKQQGWLVVAFVLGACGEGVLPGDADPLTAAPAVAHAAAADETPPVCLAAEDTPALGTWYLNAGGARWTLDVAHTAECRLKATWRDEAGDGTAQPVAAIGWSADSATLAFAVNGTWARAAVVAGVLQGRTAQSDFAPPDAAYTGHLTGWNATVLDTQLVPRTFELTTADGQHAVLRLDRGAGPHQPLQGRVKVYATDAAGAAAEEDSYDLDVQQWDGQHLVARAFHAPQTWTYTADVSGRALTGQLTVDDGSPPLGLTGTRANVLGYGLRARTAAARTDWQVATRARLALLTMAGKPQPLQRAVQTQPLALTVAPVTNPARDDDADAWLQAYTLTDVRLTLTLANPHDGPPLQRLVHAVVSRPMAPPPPGGYPLALALNGHYGGAVGTFDPNGTYWYGDAFARRGYVVVAVDVGHRPLADRQQLYGDLTDGDDPGNGNVPHPAIAADGWDSDWEEDGERTWDALQALDYATTLPDVNAQQMCVVGLSMGGEVATQVAALEPRVGAAVVAGYAPDLGVMAHHSNHPCWQWQHADIREFVDISDHEALIAPRGLIVETGVLDTTFSARTTPFAADKQVLRRARAAFQDVPHRIWHYLHAGAHAWHAGDVAGPLPATNILKPLEIAPTRRWSLQWQEDARTHADPQTVFAAVQAVLASP